ncbi:hypothetical protein JJB11_02775 [Ramlibacter ginsenosidimutans]|uniref:Uncharacterized protein n=1 Tax=Ramlibacter ginsenosidimutans TaxID=502333 RepID=A0A934TP94_9BURK|nr:hypothetical protein [Ramlibacter ginsenosidimutans]MBK6005006.1 hypothetical protein [Ramlibacter ginsenosidimutans]
MNDPATASRDYLYLRQCLAPRWAEADAEVIESWVDQRLGPGAAAYYDALLEGFFDDIGRALRTAAPAIANVAGGVARGAMAGSSLGLPGIIGGALVGGTGTALSSYGSGTARDIGNVLNTGTQFASQFTPMGQLGNQVGSTISGLGHGPMTAQRGLGAAGQLASALGRPEVQQALIAMQMGQAGRTSVPVGSNGTQVPTAAIAGMVNHLAQQAVAEAAAWGNVAGADLGYMAGANGEWVGDPSEDGDRAARVWDLLNRAQLERLQATVATARPPRPAFGGEPLPADWRALLTQDMLAGIGEAGWDGEATEAWNDEAWADEAWEPEASDYEAVDWRMEPVYG